jgi:hypothetical protein
MSKEEAQLKAVEERGPAGWQGNNEINKESLFLYFYFK